MDKIYTEMKQAAEKLANSHADEVARLKDELEQANAKIAELCSSDNYLLATEVERLKAQLAEANDELKEIKEWREIAVQEIRRLKVELEPYVIKSQAGMPLTETHIVRLPIKKGGGK